MSRELANCEKCPFNGRSHVPGMGPDKADIVFVGDYPGPYEMFQGKPFSGQAGTMLRKCLEHVGLDPSKYYYTMAVLCNPPDKHKFKQADLDCCRERLIAEIKAREPKLVVLMGNKAVEAVTRTKMGISNIQGQTIFLEDLQCQVLYSYHPAAVFKAPKNFADLNATMAKIPQILNLNLSDKRDLTTKFQIVDNELVALKYIEALQKKSYIACDIETTGFNWMTCKFLCLALCWEEGKVIVLTRQMLESPLVRAALKKLFENRNIKFIWQNGKFDIKFIRHQLKIWARVDEDILLKHYCIDERKGTHDLETMSVKYLGASGYKSKFQSKLKFENGLSFTPDEFKELYEYCAQDTDYTFRLCFVFDPLLDAEGNSRKTYEYILIRASEVLCRAEMRGFLVDQVYLEKIRVEFELELEKLLTRLSDIVYEQGWNSEQYAAAMGAKTIPDAFNIASPKQLSFAVIHVLGLPKYKNGYGTDKKAMKFWLEKLGAPKEKAFDKDEEGYKAAVEAWVLESPINEFIHRLTTYRKKSKIYSTYIMGVKKALYPDGRVHPTFMLHGTETGRLACKEPNMQNPPRGPLIKNLFIVEEGWIIIQADYSQAELRVLAVESGDPTLRKVYFEDRDLHDEVAIQLYGPNFSKEDRVKVKAVNFGIPYGRSEYTIAEEYGMPLKDARDVIRKWFAQLPVAGDYVKEMRAYPKKHGGYTVETAFGRKRRFPLITEENANSVENEAINFPISSTASDCTLLSCVEIMLDHYIDERFDAHIINEVHDSIVVEVPLHNAYPVAMIMKQVMASLPGRELGTDVPFKADIEIGKCYGAVKKADLEELKALHEASKVV